MARVIDADTLADKVAYSQHNNPHTDGKVKLNHHNEHNHFLKMIFDAPTVDAEIVVRCKNCTHRHESEFCECRDPDFFCADGERSEGE